MANLEHVDIQPGEIHPPHNWEYADAAARAAAVITDATLVKRIALQLDDGAGNATYWLLMGVSPAVWKPVGGVGGGGGVGPQGPPGADGADGTNGNTVRSGAGAPASGLGVDGDFFINTTPGVWNIYGPKAAGAWGAPTSLIGPPGSAANIPVKYNGAQITASVTSFNFAGTGVSATVVGNDVTVTIPAATAASVGLGSVDNTPDANKPVSAAQATAIAAKEPAFAAGAVSQWLRGDKTFQALTKADVGLPNVDNTSDANKPVSTAQAAADAASLTSAKAYADSLVVGLWDDRGSYNASSNVFPSAGGSGSAGAVLKGDIWTISTGGTLGGTAVSPQQTVRALSDAPGQTAGNWAISLAGLANIDDTITDGVVGRAPSQNAVFDALVLKENAITAGATSQYLRGDKTLATFASDVIASVLTGLSVASSAAAVATDTVLQAIGKLQGQFNALGVKDGTGGFAGLTLFKINFKNAANSFTSFLTNANTAARTYTFPDFDATMATVAGVETLTNKTLTNPTITGYTESGSAPAAGAAGTVDLSIGTDWSFTTNANFILTLPAVAVGKSFTVEMNFGGAHTLGFAGGPIRWTNGNVAPTATSVNGKADLYSFKANRAGTAWIGQDAGRNW